MKSSKPTSSSPLEQSGSFNIVNNTTKERMISNNVQSFAIPQVTKSPRSTTMENTNSYTSATPIKESNNNKDAGVFNISWGGNDEPPSGLHLIKEGEEVITLSKPLPRPRGIRKLPEPEPSEDGTIDEDTLKRRRNTDAARRSRLRKFIKVDQLECEVKSLQAENAKHILNNAVLEAEKRCMYVKEIEYKKRIQYLEGILKRNGWDGGYTENDPSAEDITLHQ